MATPVRKVTKASAPAPVPAAPPPAPAAPSAAAVDPTATVAAPAIKQEPVPSAEASLAPKVSPSSDTCEVRPKHGFPIFVHRQRIMAAPGVWTLVRRDSWIDTQVKARILEVK